MDACCPAADNDDPQPTSEIENMISDWEADHHASEDAVTKDVATREVSDLEGKYRNRIPLPSAFHPLIRCASVMFAALAKTLQLFIHAGNVTEVVVTGRGHAELRVIGPSEFRSRAELAGELWRDGVDKHGKRISRPTTCSEDAAKALLASREAQLLLPKVSIVSAASILTVDGDGAPTVLGPGYSPLLGGVFVASDRLPSDSHSLEDAKRPILTAIRDFGFATPSDKARALAALLSPALVYGRLLGESRAPMFVIEANHSQAGKGYFTALVAAIYGERPSNVVPRKGGVGSFDEDFSATLLKGCPFIMLDNLKNVLDSPHIESFMTAFGPFLARTFRRAPAPIDRTRYIIFATSNGFEASVDLQNRAVRIMLRKQRQDYIYDTYGGMDVLDYVRAHQSFYLGCVLRIIREWIVAGRPRSGETRHSFREWAQAMDWILVNVFADEISGRLMDFDTLATTGDLASEFGFEAPDGAED